MSEPHKLNDAEIYYDLLLVIAEVEGVKMIDITETATIPLALKRLSLGVKYTAFDLEATRRERDYLKKLLGDDGKKS